jgi:hypothetical protein
MRIKCAINNSINTLLMRVNKGISYVSAEVYNAPTIPVQIRINNPDIYAFNTARNAPTIPVQIRINNPEIYAFNTAANTQPIRDKCLRFAPDGYVFKWVISTRGKPHVPVGARRSRACARRISPQRLY